jgi:hypothetical protein
MKKQAADGVIKAGRQRPDASTAISEAIAIMAANSEAKIASSLAREWAVHLNRALVPARATNRDQRVPYSPSLHHQAGLKAPTH